MINISKIYDQKYTMLLDQMYQKVDQQNISDDKDQPQDVNGYLGQTKFYRTRVDLVPITEDEIFQVFAQDNKLKSIMMTIKEIDKDHNGFVTSTELDDIMKLYYRAELSGKELLPFINKFASPQNRILIHYKSFQSYVKKKVMKAEQEIQEKKKKIETALKSKTLVNERIKDLQGQVEKISENERGI